MVENLPPATYTLVISEVWPGNKPPATLTCLYFTLDLLIEADSNTVFDEAAANELPATLDSVAFLSYTSYVHFAGVAFFARPWSAVHDPVVSFTLAAKSIVRVLVQRTAIVSVYPIFGTYSTTRCCCRCFFSFSY